ncbi:MAG: DUF4386 domain-containing protein [Candidatus Promineofilum sp.]|nr:DUF4386 domain-containing protein [Promineifilum sp.]
MNANAYSDKQTLNIPQTTKARSRKIALAGGIFYLLTFVSIPTAVLYAGVRDPNFIAGAGSDNPVIIGAILEIIVALAGIATAVALYPVVKRQNESLALGFVGARTLEAATIFGGVVSLMTLVTLRQSGAGTEALFTGRALLAMYDWFHLGQTLIPAVNAALIGTLVYRARLVPRILPILGFIAAPLLVAHVIMLMFDVSGPLLTLTTLGVLPIAIWEFSLGVYLTVKGFKPSAITAEYDIVQPGR